MRYDRQTRLFKNGGADQLKLAQSNVLVVGAGGLGATVLPLLIGAGCGRITIIDHDDVAMHNLHRQTLFREDDVGRNKAECAQFRLSGLNSEVSVHAIADALTPGNAHDLIDDHTLIMDASDSVVVTYTLSDICFLKGKPLISASVSGHSGHVGGFCAGAPSYRAVFPNLPTSVRTCGETGVTGPAVAALGALGAEMALDVMIESTPSPLGLLYYADLLNWRSTHLRFDDAPEPTAPYPEFIDFSGLEDHDRVFVLGGQLSNQNLPKCRVETISLSDIGNISPVVTSRYVFACRRGITAWRAALLFMARSKATNVAVMALNA